MMSFRGELSQLEEVTYSKLHPEVISYKTILSNFYTNFFVNWAILSMRTVFTCALKRSSLPVSKVNVHRVIA